MTVAVLIDRLNVGGVEKVAIEEVRGLRAIGTEAVLVVLSRRAVVPGAFEDLLRGVPVTYLEDRLPRLLRASFRIPGFYFFSSFHLTYPLLLPAVVARGEFAHVVSHGTYTSLTAMSLARFRTIPYALYLWDPASSILETVYRKGPISRLRPVLSRLALGLDRRLVNRADKVFVAGDRHGRTVTRLLRDPARLVFLPPGHRAARSLPATRGDYLVTATAWKHGKRLEDLIEVVATLPGARLTVAGRWVHDGYRREIEALVERLGLATRVDLLGPVTEEELDDLYLHARAAVMVSVERGFGLLALEAAANGCPFVVPRSAGATRYFSEGEHGLYFPDGDRDALAGHLSTLLADERLARALGRSAWEEVRSRYTWERHARRLAEALGGDGAPGRVSGQA